jgi:hypothetical protein
LNMKLTYNKNAVEWRRSMVLDWIWIVKDIPIGRLKPN